jgi:class 3 adenylate cyclase/tetratricopeptide (TPR) repeat protein
MNCPKCGQDIPFGRRFCEGCGARSGKECSNCQAVAAADARFCGICGSAFVDDSVASSPPLAAASTGYGGAADSGERRQLTVLFADLVGATALSGRIDPEALRELLRTYHEICVACVSRFGGTISQYLGDGVLAYFGYPSAHEDDAQRAVLAGLVIVDEIHKLRDAYSTQAYASLDARVGIHTGLVVVGEMGAGRVIVNLAVGETPNIAARVQGEALPRSVCISAATRRLLRGRFELTALGARPMKGVETDMELFAVVAAIKSHREQRQVLPAPPLIGRAAELEQLIGLWGLAQRGQGQAVYISGEGGIGKSRLLASFRERAAADRKHWLNVWCSSIAQNSALQPLIDMLDQSIDESNPTSSDDRLHALEQLLLAAGIADAASFALLASLLGLGGDHAAVLGDLAPAQRKRQTLEALITLLLVEARRHPLVLVVEDLHWIDPSSRDLFGLLLDRISNLSILLILTFRPEFVPTWTPRCKVPTIALNRLSPAEVMSVVAGVTVGTALPTSIVDEVVRRADGVPLFVEEITKAIITSGLVVERAGQFQLATSQGAPIELPTTLRDSLTARLDRLGNAKAVAQLAAVLGREFDYGLLRSVSDFADDELQAQLLALNHANIIYQSGSTPDSHYIFKHALIQEAAYDGLLKSTRQRYHRLVANSYVEGFAELARARPDLPAYHFSRAAMPATALPFWQKAGELAVAREGSEEAIAYLAAALEQIELLPDTPDRAALELAMRVTVGPAFMTRLGFGAAETGANYARACELAEVAGDSTERFTAMWGDWLFKNTRGQLVAASRRSQDLVSISRKLPDDGYLLQAHHSRWTNFLVLGDAAVARADTLDGIAIYDPVRHRQHKHRYGGHDPGVCAYCFGSVAAWVTGHSCESLQLSARAQSLALELDHVFTLTSTCLLPALVHYETRAFEAALATAERGIDLGEKHGLPQWIGFMRVVAGISGTRCGDVDTGISLAEAGLKAHMARGPAIFSPMLCALTAQAHMRVDHRTRAAELLQQGREMSTRTDVGWYLPEILRLELELQFRSRQITLDETIARAQQAIALARQQSAIAWEWRTASVLAEILQREGRIDEARECLREPCGPRSDGLDSVELDEAKARLATLESVSR